MTMNKYLEKIANFSVRKDSEIGHVKAPEKVVSPGAKLATGAKTLFNRALYKAARVAEETSHKQDIINTGVIAGLGGVGTLASHKIMKASPKLFDASSKMHSAKVTALGTGIGLAADYVGLKLNKQINQHVQ